MNQQDILQIETKINSEYIKTEKKLKKELCEAYKEILTNEKYDLPLKAICKTISEKDNTERLITKQNSCIQKEIGKVATKKINAIFRLIKIQKQLTIEKSKAKAITTPKDIYQIFHPFLENKKQEYFIVVALNTSNKIIMHEIVAMGTLNQVIIHPREIFKRAIMLCANSIIIIHNHPSGDPEPSNEDITITKKLVEAGKLMDIKVLDHIIIGRDYFYSFQNEKLIFE